MNSFIKFNEYKNEIHVEDQDKLGKYVLRYNLNDKNKDICDRIGLKYNLPGEHIYIYNPDLSSICFEYDDINLQDPYE